MIIEALRFKGAVVQYNDPYIPEIMVAGEVLRGVDLTAEALARPDCVFVHTGHREYVGVKAEMARSLVDCRS